MMRAKLMVIGVTTPYEGAEQVSMQPVCGKPFDASGESEDNTYARWTPSGSLSLTITNPALHGQFKYGDTFYADFTRVEPAAPAESAPSPDEGPES